MDIEALEQLALAEDRSAALATLLPGTIEHDYWRSIGIQHEGRLDEVDAILATWSERHGRDAHYERLRRRQVLLRADRDLATGIVPLQYEVGVVCDDRAEVVVQAERHPQSLDPALIEGTMLLREELQRRADLSQIRDVALQQLVPLLGQRDAARRRELLDRLERTSFGELVPLVLADLAEKSSGGFGSVGVHAWLTHRQLLQLVEKRPSLATETAWVEAVLLRLRPRATVDLLVDDAERSAYLDRLAAFVTTLEPIFNTLKAAVFHARLVHDQRRGVYDRERFLAYLELPRHAPWVATDWLGRVRSEHLVQPHAVQIDGLAPVRDDEALVRDYVQHLLRSEDASAFATRLRPEWLAQQQAITHLTSGMALDPERWAKVLGPSALAALKDRVDIDLAPQNRAVFGADDDVSLEVDVKNVRELEVKVFRINAVSYFLAKGGAEVDTTIDLDGMIPSGEALRVYSEAPPIVRKRRRIELPACKRPGTYVVELIGNGRSSRALVRKGELRYSVRTGASGVVVTVRNEQGVPLPGARLWYGGRELAPRSADATSIVIPFSTHASGTSALLVHGDIAQAIAITGASEHVQLEAGIHLERESLVPNQSARVLVRPSLHVGGGPASLALLEDARVDIVVTDLAGTSVSQTQRVALVDDADLVVSMNVPDGAVHVGMTLRGRVRVVSTQQTVDVESGSSAPVNTIHSTDLVASAHLARTSNGYELNVLGKTGEAIRERAVAVELRHRNVDSVIAVTLETNERGTIDLGTLDGIEELSTSFAGGADRRWYLTRPIAVPARLHAVAQATILVPAPLDAVTSDYMLAETRAGAVVTDLTAHVTMSEGCAVFRLPPGEYRLACRFHPPVEIHVVPAAEAGWGSAGNTLFELSPALPIVRSFAAQEDEIVLRLSSPSEDTRVHLVATRFVADRALSSSLARPPYAPERIRFPSISSVYVSGRDIGDEYRYVLERRNAPRRAGTMLEKPSLLLNPWALRTTSTSHQHAAIGGAYGMSAAPVMASFACEPMADREDTGSHASVVTTPSVDFLAHGATVLANLRPDADGIVRIPRSDVGDAQLVQAFVVDPVLSSSVELALAPQPLRARDLRLRHALDPARHYAEDRSVVSAPEGGSFVVPDVRTGKLELVDSLARAHQLLVTLTDESSLREFAFVTEWTSLDEVTRRERYGKYACHELHLFLWRKDPTFFKTVVRPYLVHKRDKTFIDRFLLGEDLATFLEPWAFGRLNTVERILLGLRVPAAAPAIARLVREAVEVVPADLERDARLLATLLGASALDSGGPGGASSGGLPPAMEMLDEGDAFESAKSSKGAPSPKRALRSALPPPSPAASFARGGGGRASLAKDMAEREAAPPLYRGADKTQEWAETGWWRRRIAEETAALVAPNRFWCDLARHVQEGGETPFLSPHLGDTTTSFAESMCALAFLDLPFAVAKHDTKLEEMSLTVTPRSHALAARTHVVEIEPTAAPATTVLVGQSYFRADDRWDFDGPEQTEKYVTGELEAGVVYRCQVVVTNPTSRRQKLDLFLQIPRGAIPVESGFVTRTIHLELGGYATESTEYAFYFPLPGTFAHFPAHVTKALALQAAAEARILEVVATPTQVDLGSWSHVSQHGTLDEVLAFLDRTNLERIDLNRIAWRMHDRVAFEEVTALLVARRRYEHRLWRYAFVHHDRVRLMEWLRHQEPFLRGVGPSLPPFADAVERGWYQHLEYAPLVNARAHQLGARRKILNDALRTQYVAFLEVVAHRVKITPDDLLGAAHYLLTMDRVDDALGMLARMPTEDAAVATRLQRDYLAAYCACARGDLAAARELARRWIQHPVDRWRKRFGALVAMLDEAEGKAAPAATIDADSRDERMTTHARREPALELGAAGADIVLQHHNLASCQLRFFKLDIELVFSRQPFVQGDVERFKLIEPGLVVDVPLTPGEGRTTVPIPQDLRGANLVVQAAGDGIEKSIAHYAHDLGIQLSHAYGQVRVLRGSTQTPLPATYVKVYGRQRNGQVAFFKDGYTDLRGSFDYATLSTDDLDRVERLAILVVSDEAGATIVEAPPPPR